MKSRSTSNHRRRLHDVPQSEVRWRGRLSKKSHKRSVLDFSWRENLTLFIGLFSVGFVAARLLGIATGDPETAYAILQAEGTGPVIVGSLIPAVSLLLFPLAVIGLSYSTSKVRYASASNLLLMTVVGIFATIVTVFTAPAGIFVTSILFTLIATLLARFSLPVRRRTGDKWPSLYIVLIAYAVAVLAFTSLSSEPWLPSDNITLKGQRDFSAFILNQNSQATFILTQNPTAVVQLSSNQIVTTEICKTPSYRSLEATINQWLGNILRTAMIYSYPECAPGYFAKSRSLATGGRSRTIGDEG